MYLKTQKSQNRQTNPRNKNTAEVLQSPIPKHTTEPYVARKRALR